MAIGGFLQGLGLAAGRNLIVGQEMENTQSQIDLGKADIAQKQQQMAAIATQQQTAKAVGDYVNSEMQKDASVVTDPVKEAKLYENATGIALRAGDFASANTMSELAKLKLNEAKEAAAVQAQQMQVKKEDLANEADSFATNPTQEGANRLVQKAVAAGVDPSSIPKNPNSPQFKAWANEQQLASKTASQRADFIQKAAEQDENRREKQREFNIRQGELQQQRQQTALLRESAEADRRERLKMDRERLDFEETKYKEKKEAGAAGSTGKPPIVKTIGDKQYEYDPSNKLEGTRDLPDKGWVKVGEKGVKETAQERNTNKAVIASGREAIRGLHIVGAMDSDQTAGPFAGLHNGTILESLSKTGTNAMTPEDMQIYHTATQGLGLEIARTMTLGGGRGANQSTINEMQDIVTAHPGDSKATIVFKYANAVDIVRNRLESMGVSADPQQEKLRQDTLSELNKVPTPAQVLKTIKDPKQRKAALDAQGKMEDVAGKMSDESAVPSAAPAGASTPALPSGWSVKVH